MNEKKCRRYSSRGVTLVALVITIIILIILAGISIGSLTGQNGIIKNAAKAKVDYEIAQYIDRVELARGSVAIENLGVVTIDNLIEQIYKDEIVPRGNITKQDEISAKMITVEGYEFIITADNIEYIGNSGTKEETIPDLVEGMIIISKETWNASTHTASVSITKGNDVSDSLEIQYQVNGYEEEKWETGTEVTNLKHNDTVYARLWNGVTGGKNYASQDIKDGIAPKDASIRWTWNMTVLQGNNVYADVSLKDDESGVDVGNSRWTVTTSSTIEVGTDPSSYSGTFSGTNTYQKITINQTTCGTYFLHVLTQDKAGNKVETIDTRGITVTQRVTGVSLNKSSTAIEKQEIETLIATVTPENAANKEVIWSTSNPEVATVDSDGMVRGIGTGTATITVTTKEGNKTASCVVTVPPTVDELRAGAYIKYDTGVTTVGDNGIVMFRVLYPLDSEYGLQIISDKNIGDETNLIEPITSWEEGKGAYNGAIQKLNEEAEKYVNSAYAYDGRCVGSIPTVEYGMFVNKNKLRDDEGNIYEQGSTVLIPDSWSITKTWGYGRDTECYEGDANYEIDNEALWNANVGVAMFEEPYWLASRRVEMGSESAGFYVLYGGFSTVSSEQCCWVATDRLMENSFGERVRCGLRPCISLKSDIIKITGGDGWSEATAYTIGK